MYVASLQNWKWPQHTYFICISMLALFTMTFVLLVDRFSKKMEFKALEATTSTTNIEQLCTVFATQIIWTSQLEKFFVTFRAYRMIEREWLFTIENWKSFYVSFTESSLPWTYNWPPRSKRAWVQCPNLIHLGLLILLAFASIFMVPSKQLILYCN